MAKARQGNRKNSPKVGLWMVGACGGVGSAVALGLAALRKKLIPPVGLVTELPELEHCGLIDPADLVVGGHEVRSATLVEAVEETHRRAGVFDRDLITACVPQLRSFQRNIVPGTLAGAGKVIHRLANRNGTLGDRSAGQAVERLADDLHSFRRKHRLDHVVVVHIASSEPPVRLAAVHRSYAKLDRALSKKGAAVLPGSAIYALAAIEAKCAFINFTPSPALDLPAIRERADAVGTLYMGSDGKTGESLVKSFLAPMFALRNLSVLSWIGQNILGNRDGEVLSDPKTRESKIRSKGRILSQLTDRAATTTKVSIDYVPSLSDWKVAWDFIHFEGFLGTKMSLQFTWQGSDSVLAAPLIIDLVRLAARELACGRSGPMTHLACFFKDPIDVGAQSYFDQWRLLLDHLAETKVAR